MDRDPVIIDGAEGEGGGQMLRTSLSLSLLTGRPFRMINVRANRERPGLQRQHLTCVQAAAAVGNAQTKGAAVGSAVVDFEPGSTVVRDFRFDVGTAGSTMLVLQTVLPALLTAGQACRVTLTGGTHNPMAPCFEFLSECFLPAIRRMGATVDMELERHGFYPAGGGVVHVNIGPAAVLQPLELMERGPLGERRARVICSRLPAHVAEREMRVVRDRLRWRPEELEAEDVAAFSPANVLLLRTSFAHVSEVVTSIGAPGKPAERVAAEAVDELEAYLASDAPVGEHLADQLLLPLVMAGGGRFLTRVASSHLVTNAATIRKFVDCRIEITDTARGVLVDVAR